MNNGILPSPERNAFMPKNDNLYEQFIAFENLKRSFKQTQLGRRKFRNESIHYNLNMMTYLVHIWQELKSCNYKSGGYKQFYIYKPKKRLIYAPYIKDKIVMFAAHTVLQKIYMPVWITNTYACIDGRGSHDAVRNVQHDMKYVKWKYDEGWILKIDISNYFYSIKHDLLKGLYRKQIADERFLKILDEIVDGSPESVGIPLGNVTSQDFANIVLNELDQYCKRFLGVKHYTRYMDDIVIIVPTREQAKEIREQALIFLHTRLFLSENIKKTKIFPISQGVNAYGYRIYTTHTLIRDKAKKSMKRRIKAMDKKLQQNEVTEEYVKQCVNSWLGHARHSNSYKLSSKLLKNYRYIKVEGKYKFGQEKLIN